MALRNTSSEILVCCSNRFGARHFASFALTVGGSFSSSYAGWKRVTPDAVQVRTTDAENNIHDLRDHQTKAL